MPVTGDPKRIGDLSKRLQKLSGVAEVVAKIVAPKFEALTDQGFVSKTDPYGDPWKQDALKTFKNGTESILVRSGKLARSFGWRPFGPKVKVDIGVFYARYHISTGRGFLPQRGKWPATWDAPIRDAAQKATREIAEGRR